MGGKIGKEPDHTIKACSQNIERMQANLSKKTVEFKKKLHTLAVMIPQIVEDQISFEITKKVRIFAHATFYLMSMKTI